MSCKEAPVFLANPSAPFNQFVNIRLGLRTRETFLQETEAKIGDVTC